MQVLVAATPEKERLEDVRAAAELEIMYMVEQGIISRSPLTSGACVTLKLLFLFSCEMDWSKNRLEEFWRRNIVLSAHTGVGLYVHEVFDEDSKVEGQALEWMNQFDRNREFTPSPFFMPPKHDNQPSVGDGMDAFDGGGGVSDDEVLDPGVSDDRGIDEASLMSLVAELDRLREPTPQSVKDLLSAFDPETPPTPLSTPFEFDTGVVINCIEILRSSTKKKEYIKSLPNLRKAVDVEGESEEEGEVVVDPAKVGQPPDDEVRLWVQLLLFVCGFP